MNAYLKCQLTKCHGLDRDEEKHPIRLVGHSGHKGDKGKGGKDGWWNSGKGGKGKSKDRDKGEKGKGQGKSGGSAEHFAGYCGKCGLWGHKQKSCRRQVNAVEEEQQQQQQPLTDVGHLSATDATGWIYTVVVDDRSVDESPEQMDASPDEDSKREVDESPRATEAEVSPIIVDDRKMVETPVAEVTTEGHYGVEAILDSGAGASVCSPNDFPTVAIDTQSEVMKLIMKVYRCADGRELLVYGYKWVKAIVGKTQQILQIRFT
eukprot:4331161-Amphidinium_carterae.2